jgi:hypothetical protein
MATKKKAQHDTEDIKKAVEIARDSGIPDYQLRDMISLLPPNERPTEVDYGMITLKIEYPFDHSFTYAQNAKLFKAVTASFKPIEVVIAKGVTVKVSAEQGAMTW